MIVGRIEPEDLRQEIIHAKKEVDKFTNYPGTETNRNDLFMWGRILNILVKQIVPVE